MSPLNRQASVVGDFPATVTLRDITLRSMEQMPGVLPSTEERLGFLRSLAAAGVREMNPSGFVRKRSIDELRAEVEAVRQIDDRCELVYLGPVTEDDFEAAAAAGYSYVQLLSAYLGAAMPMIVGQTYHRLWHDREWQTLRFPKSPSDQIERSVRLTALAKQFNLKVSAGINLAAFVSDTYIAEYSGAVANAGAEEVMLLDSSGGLGPEAFAHISRIAKEAAPGARIGIHAHDTFGLAVAAGIAAARAGADVVEVAVNGYVMGPPQADLAAMGVAFEALYGVDTRIDLSSLVALSREAERMTGVPIAPNYPVTGREFFALGEPDQYVEEVSIDPLLHKPYTPDLVGNARLLRISATTGPFGMWTKLEQLGLDAEKEQIEPILHACWALMEREKRAVSDEQIRDLALSYGAKAL
ncbi:MAG TPA: hypothetical protein VKT78_02295 [Fimbriimonadaceae bacterium]|nr:hypothetical protein [Fimbriimonadaceae bacterium]